MGRMRPGLGSASGADEGDLGRSGVHWGGRALRSRWRIAKKDKGQVGGKRGRRQVHIWGWCFMGTPGRDSGGHALDVVTVRKVP